MQQPLDLLFILAFWIAVGAVLITPVYAITELLDRHRNRVPHWLRQISGFLTEGDQIRCPHCERKTPLIAGQPDPTNRQPLGATCPNCGWHIHQH